MYAPIFCKPIAIYKKIGFFSFKTHIHFLNTQILFSKTGIQTHDLRIKYFTILCLQVFLFKNIPTETSKKPSA